MIKKYQVHYADDSVLVIVASTDEEARVNAKYAHDSVVMSIEEVNPLFVFNEPVQEMILF